MSKLIEELEQRITDLGLYEDDYNHGQIKGLKEFLAFVEKVEKEFQDLNINTLIVKDKNVNITWEQGGNKDLLFSNTRIILKKDVEESRERIFNS